MDCSSHGSSDNGIFQARILEWVAMPSSRGSSQPRDPTHVSRNNTWATREVLLAFQVGFIYHLNLPITLKHIDYGLRFEWIKFLWSDMCRIWSFTKLWHMGHTQPSVSLYKLLLKQSHGICSGIFCGCFVLQMQGWVDATETIWPAKSKMFISGPYRKKGC